MKVLHLFGNWKWTGPAELALHACAGVRAQGADARFAAGRVPPGSDPTGCVRDRARSRGVPLVLEGLTLSKHRRPIAGLLDARRLRAYVRAEGIEVVHSHLPGDHWVASRALPGLDDVRLVRSVYDPTLPSKRHLRRLLRASDALVCAAGSACEAARRDLGIAPERARHVETPIDLARFDEGRALPDADALLDLERGDLVLGIVARMQRHRRFEVLLEAFRQAARDLPRLRLVVIGRGTHQEEVAKAPARALGIADRVRFPGYLEGDAFVAAVRRFDAKVFLVPGSDGSCRAVREALALGVPVICARRGMLPEIVREGRTGLVVDDHVEGLRDAIVRLLGDDALRARLGEAARSDARERFSVEANARALIALYESALASPRT